MLRSGKRKVKREGQKLMDSAGHFTEKLPMHILPADKLFRIYITDGAQSRVVLWFKYNNKGDLVTKPLVATSNVSQSYGTTKSGNFVLTQPSQVLELTGNEHCDHPHITYHPSSKNYAQPVMHGVKRKTHVPVFDTRTLAECKEVARHLLATPAAYSVRSPKSDDDPYHAMLTRPYDNIQQPTVTFWAAPLLRGNEDIPDDFIIRGCFLYARCSPSQLPHDILIQVALSRSPYTDAGDMHIVCAPTLDQISTV